MPTVQECLENIALWKKAYFGQRDIAVDFKKKEVNWENRDRYHINRIAVLEMLARAALERAELPYNNDRLLAELTLAIPALKGMKVKPAEEAKVLEAPPPVGGDGQVVSKEAGEGKGKGVETVLQTPPAQG